MQYRVDIQKTQKNNVIICILPHREFLMNRHKKNQKQFTTHHPLLYFPETPLSPASFSKGCSILEDFKELQSILSGTT